MVESSIDVNRSEEMSMVVYWHPEHCIDELPYRKIVRWMIDTWRPHLEVRLISEPKEEPFEDFVVHHFSAGDRRFGIYWENSLGYISLQSADESLIRKLAAILKDMRPVI